MGEDEIRLNKSGQVGEYKRRLLSSGYSSCVVGLGGGGGAWREFRNLPLEVGRTGSAELLVVVGEDVRWKALTMISVAGSGIGVLPYHCLTGAMEPCLRTRPVQPTVLNILQCSTPGPWCSPALPSSGLR